MKALITSFNKKLGLNPMVGRLLDAIPDVQRTTVEEAEMVFLSFICPASDFVPDTELIERVLARKLPLVIFDHEEVFGEDFILGRTMVDEASSYRGLYQAVGQLPIKAYFKREFLTQQLTRNYFKALSFPVYPLDWTLDTKVAATVSTRQEYEARPIDIFMSWGYSNESRPRLMAELLRQAGRFGAHFCLTEQDLDIALAEKRQRIFALLFTPHYRRIHISRLMAWQEQSKVSVSLFGAGKKCFRCAEASYNTVMAQQAPNELQWSYLWSPSINCVRLAHGGCGTVNGDSCVHETEEQSSVNHLYQCLRIYQGDLYDIYIKGMENNRNYHTHAYASEYLLPKIRLAVAA